MASSFFAELKRRGVLRVALAYLAGSWLLIQVAETLFPVFGLSDGTIRAIVIVLAIGFFTCAGDRLGLRDYTRGGGAGR